MRYLLDTNAWVWMVAEPEHLSGRACDLVEDPANQLFLSVASVWELAIKYGRGRLPLPTPIEVFVPEQLRLSGVSVLAVEQVHALRVAALPHHHKDPFDRLLVAQAQVDRLPVITADRIFERYDVEVVRAR